jgi:tellurite resistance protein TerC
MDKNMLMYLVFGVVMFLGLLLDLGLFSKKNTIVSFNQALVQTGFWVLIALGFFTYLWFEQGSVISLEYLSAYLMEWSLSIDNIFVFIIIFTSFGVKDKFYGRVLLIGIMMAIVFRIIFITVGVSLVERFHWLLYIFGVFLLYTGIKIFRATEDEEFDPHQSIVYKWLKKFLPISNTDGNGKFMIKENGRPVYTILFVVVILLGAVDLVFALDSIPAVMGISTNKLVIYTSNIFAVLGLRSLFFLLRKAVSKFDYLQQGIGIVLIFIGIKMLGEHWLKIYLSDSMLVLLSLLIIILCITGSIWFSIYHQKKGSPKAINGTK